MCTCSFGQVGYAHDFCIGKPYTAAQPSLRLCSLVWLRASTEHGPVNLCTFTVTL